VPEVSDERFACANQLVESVDFAGARNHCERSVGIYLFEEDCNQDQGDNFDQKNNTDADNVLKKKRHFLIKEAFFISYIVRKTT
jgi:hypothetical protein